MEKRLISRIQKLLTASSLPGWLFYSFRHSDPLGERILGLRSDAHATRRWFYLIPQSGPPLKLVHRIESGVLDDLPGKANVYLRWNELEQGIRDLLGGMKTVAMQYSEGNAIPYVSKVDAGTVDFIRSLGVEVVSSSDLLQAFEAVWSNRQYEQHVRAAALLTTIVREAFQSAREALVRHGHTTEFAVQEFILKRFREERLVSDFPPIVGVNANSGDPHYMPTSERHEAVGWGDFLLVDLWARGDEEDSVFADITWTGFFGSDPPQRMVEVFEVVRKARDRGVEFLNERVGAGLTTQGWEVDDAVRAVIEQRGMGESFVHRTGHNLGREVHGNGVNFDNLETHDTRGVIAGIGGTIEPGIYLDEFGVRSEINIFVRPDSVEITTPPQKELLLLKS